MDQQQLIEHIENQYRENIKIAKAKNSDYANSHDPFYNFRLCEIFGLCAPEVGIMVRLLDKIGRIANLINWAPAVKDETIHDTISDAQNYLGFLDAYLTERETSDVADGAIVDYLESISEALKKVNYFTPCNSQYVSERGQGEGI